MLYFIKIIYRTFLLPPGIFILAFLLLSLRIYKKQRKVALFLMIITLTFYLCSTSIFSNILLHRLENKYKPPTQIRGDVIVMLGGGALLDTPNLNGKGHLQGTSANRLLTCLQLYHQLKIPLILSGGQVYRSLGNEAEIAKRILREVGIPSDKIIIETKSLNTTENARFSKKLLDEFHYHQPILVTSAFHMPRAVKQFKKAGVTVIPYPADYHTNINGEFEFYKLLPSSEALNKVSISLKEYLGLLAIKWY